MALLRNFEVSSVKRPPERSRRMNGRRKTAGLISMRKQHGAQCCAAYITLRCFIPFPPLMAYIGDDLVAGNPLTSRRILASKARDQYARAIDHIQLSVARRTDAPPGRLSGSRLAQYMASTCRDARPHASITVGLFPLTDVSRIKISPPASLFQATVQKKKRERSRFFWVMRSVLIATPRTISAPPMDASRLRMFLIRASS